MIRHLETELEIAAPPAAVWAVLTDTERYGEWNPFVTRFDAPAGLAEGARLRVTIAPPGAKAMTLAPRVLACEPEHELRWIGHLGLPRVFDGEHRFRLTALPGGRTRFEQSERFRGILVRPVWRKIGASTRTGFEAMNTALASRVSETGQRGA